MESKRGKALITGASAGIGAVYAEQLARDGYDVVLVARRKERLDALASRLRSAHGVQAEVLPADLANAEDVRRVADKLRRDPAISLLINNAGFGGYRPFHELDPVVADQLIDVHIRAVVQLTRTALPGMLERKQGAVINVASLLSLSGTLPPNPLPYRAVYAGAKSFLLTFTQALAGEIRNSGVTVQVCLPGMVATEFHTIQGMSRSPHAMSPEDVVTASLAALRTGEWVCVPGLDDPSLLDRLGEAQRAILQRANTSALAARYRPRS